MPEESRAAADEGDGARRRSAYRGDRGAGRLPAAVADAPGHPDRDVHGRVRHLGGQRRGALAPARPARQRRGAAAHRRRLRVHVRERHGHRGQARRPVRLQADVPDRRGDLRARLAGVRARPLLRRARRLPARAGAHRRGDGPAGSRPHHGFLPGAGAEPRPGLVRRHHGVRLRVRADPRRRADPGQHPRPRLARDLPGERAGRCRRGDRGQHRGPAGTRAAAAAA